MTELEVPPESFDAMGSLWTGDEESAEWIRAIATPVVAAAVRRLACDPRLDGNAFRVLTDYARALEMQMQFRVESGGAS